MSKWKAAFHTRAYASFAKKGTTCVSTSAVTEVIRRSRSRCTMASAYTSARANHERTEWQRAISCATGGCFDRPAGLRSTVPVGEDTANPSKSEDYEPFNLLRLSH